MSAIIAATARAYGQARAPTQPRGKDLALLRWTRIRTDRHPTQLAHALAGPDHHLMAHGRPSHSHTHTVPDAPVPASCADGAPRGQPYRPVQLDLFDAVIAAHGRAIATAAGSAVSSSMTASRSVSFWRSAAATGSAAAMRSSWSRSDSVPRAISDEQAVQSGAQGIALGA